MFYGLKDLSGESWEDSERQVLSLCSDHLGVHVTSSDIERAHKVGRFSTLKNRPIVAQFRSFKEKQNILAKAHKLRGTTLSISEDYSSKVRLERRKLVAFAKERKETFRLRFNKLIMGAQTFMYNSSSDDVEPLQ